MRIGFLAKFGSGMRWEIKKWARDGLANLPLPKQGLTKERSEHTISTKSLVCLSLIIMSLLKTLKLDAIGKYAKSMSALQLGALTATVGALAVGGYFLSPYLRIGNAITKGWLISWFCGTPEERLLRHVLSNAEKGNPSSVLATIDAWCWSKQWMMNVGDVKGVIVDEQVAKSKPMVCHAAGKGPIAKFCSSENRLAVFT